MIKNKGFTLIELLVVTSIILTLTTLTLSNYQTGERRLALQRSAALLSQDLRRVQEMTMSATFSEKTGGEFPVGGYGIFLKINTDPPPYEKKYVLFGDQDNDHEYDDIIDYLIEEVFLEKGIVIFSLQTDKAAKNKMSISFVPPDPQTYITDDSDRLWARITLALEQDLTKTKTVYINKAGLITVE